MQDIPIKQVRERHRVMASRNDNCIQRIIKRLSECEQSDFTVALVRLLGHLRRDNARIVDAEIHLPEAAWSARNIIELRVFSRFICQSGKNHKRFCDDYFGDGLDLLKALAEMTQIYEAELPNIAATKSILESTRCDAEKDLASRNWTRVPHLHPGQLASDLGLGPEYKAIHKIASKLVHPTSMSILDVDRLTARVGYGRIIVPCALISAQRLLEELDAHLTTFNDRPSID